MKSTILLLVLIVTLFLASAYYVTEGFATNRQEAICSMIHDLNMPEEVTQACEDAIDETRYCVDGCDPETMCGMVNLGTCARSSSDCDVTFMYFNNRLSTAYDEYPRIFRVKAGACFRVNITSPRWIAVETDQRAFKALLTFPTSIHIPAINETEMLTTNVWTFSNTERFDTLPLLMNPYRNSEFYSPDKPEDTVRIVSAMAMHRTSNDPVRKIDTTREMPMDEFAALIRRDSENRLPVSPTSFPVFFVLTVNAGFPPADTGAHQYAVSGGMVSTADNGARPVLGTKAIVVVQYLLDLRAGGYVVETREAIYTGKEIFVARNKYAPSSRRKYDTDAIANVRCFMGTPIPDTVLKFLRS